MSKKLFTILNTVLTIAVIIFALSVRTYAAEKYYVNGGTVKLNGLKTDENYQDGYDKLHAAVYEDQMYEYHGGRIYVGNEVILPGSELPASARVTETADSEAPSVDHSSVDFDGSNTFIYTLKDVPVEVLSCFSVVDYNILNQYYRDVILPGNYTFYAWEYEKDSDGYYARKSVAEIPASDITWDESTYVTRDQKDWNGSDVYSFSGTVNVKPNGDNPIAIVACIYDAWENNGTAAYRSGDDEICNMISQTELMCSRSHFNIYAGYDAATVSESDEEDYRPIRERADRFTNDFSLYPYFYHKDDANKVLTLYGFQSRMGQFMSGYSDLTVDDYYLDTLRIPAEWTDPDTGKTYDVAIASIADGAGSIDPGYAGTVIISEGVAFPDDCSGLFNLGSMYLNNFIIEGDPASVGSNITNMSNMFSYGHTMYSTPLSTVDIAALNTSKVTDMNHMFEGVEVSELDVSGFDVSKVTDFSYMFSACDVTSLDLSGWHTPAAVDMSHMFEAAGAFNYSRTMGKQAKGVAAMGKLHGTLDLSGFTFGSVTNMSNMFANQPYLTTVIFPDDIDTSNVTNMRYMFASCSALNEIRNIERFNTASVVDMGGMFGAWNVLPFIETREYDYLGPWLYELMDMPKDETVDTGAGSISRNDGPALTALDLSGWDTSKVKNMAGMFSLPKLESLVLSDSFHTEQVRNMNRMFTLPSMTDTGFLQYVEIRDARLAYDMLTMPLATTVSFKGIDLSNISETTYYFCYWSIDTPQVTELDLSEAEFGTNKGAFGEDTFRYMTGLSLLKLPADLPRFNYQPVMPVTYYDEDGNEYPTLPGGNRKALTLTNSENYLRDAALTAVLTYDSEETEYVPDASQDTVVMYHWGTGEYSVGDYNSFRSQYPDSVCLKLILDPEDPSPEPRIRWEVLSQTPDQQGNYVIDPRFVNGETGKWIDLYNENRYTTGTAVIRVTVNDDIVFDCNIEVRNSPYTTSGSSGNQKTMTGSDGNSYLCKVLGNGTVSVLKLKSSSASSVDLTGGIGGYTISEIGSYAFDGLANLTSVKLPASVKKIGNHAFANCGSLASFTAPGLEEIGAYAFVSDYNLYNGQAFPISAAVTKVGDYAFKYCQFTSIDLSKAVSLGRGIFAESGTLASFTYDDSKLKRWGSGNILYGSELAGTVLTEFTVPSCITQIGSLDNNYYGSPFPQTLQVLNFGPNVTVIGNYGLSGMRDLKRLNSDTDGVAVIPDTVTSVGDNAFADWNCDIHDLTIPATVTSVGKEVFSGGGKTEGKGLWDVTFSGTLDTIPNRMFTENESIKTVSIASLAEGAAVGDEAFRDCKALTSLTIDDKVTKVGIYAFKGCEKLADINAGGGSHVKFLAHAANIGKGAFDGCESLAFGEFSLPAAVSTGENAFDNCKGLKSISLPAAKSIGDHAFWGCENLTGMTFSANIESFGRQMIEKTAVSSIDLSMATGLTEIPDYAFGVYNTNLGITSKLATVVLPQGLKAIGRGAFINTPELTSVTLPEGLTAIDEAAFANSGLTAVTIPDSVRIISGTDHVTYSDSNVDKDSRGAFSGCADLSTVNFGSGLEVIGYGSFSGCAIQSVDLSESAVRIIGTGAFSKCPIRSLKLSDSTENIGCDNFYSTSFTSDTLRLPASLKTIGVNNTTYLKSSSLGSGFGKVIFPLGMETIGNNTFRSNPEKKLNLIEIPYMVTNADGIIADYLFEQLTDPNAVTANGGKEYRGLIVYGGSKSEWNRLVDTYNLTQAYPQDWTKLHILYNAGWTKGTNGEPKYIPYDFSKFYPLYMAGENYDPSADADIQAPRSSVVKMDGAFYYFNASGRMVRDTAVLYNGKISECYRITDTTDPGYNEAKKYGNFYPSAYASAGLYYFDEDGIGTLVNNFGTAGDPSASQLDADMITDGIYKHPGDPLAVFMVRDHSLVRGSGSTVLISELIMKDGSIYHAGRNGKLSVGYAESPVVEDGSEITYGWYFDSTVSDNTGKLVWYSKKTEAGTLYYKPHAGAANVKAALAGSNADLLNGSYPDEEGQMVEFRDGKPAGLSTIRVFGAETKEEAALIDVSLATEADRIELVIPEGADSTEYILKLVTEPASPLPVPKIEWSVTTNAPKVSGKQVLNIEPDNDDEHIVKIIAANTGRSRVRVTVRTEDGSGNTLDTFTKECLFVISDTNIYPEGLTITAGSGDGHLKPGETLTLNAAYTPENANTGTELIWKSSNNSVASVSADTGNPSRALVRGIKQGSAVIMATTGNKVRGSFTVIVTGNTPGPGPGPSPDPTPVSDEEEVTDIVLNKGEISLYAGENFKLSATVNPAGAKDKTVTWATSAPAVADVDNTGKVTAKAVGTAVITAESKSDPAIKAECLVTVLEKEIVDTDEHGDIIDPSAAGSGVTTYDEDNGEANIWVAGLEETYYYTGNAIKPAIHVYKGYKLLTTGTDYTLKYKNNKKVSKSSSVNVTADKKKPQIIITMKGAYSGSKTVYFDIIPMPLDKLEFGDGTTVSDNILLTGAYKAKKKNQLKPTLMYDGANVKYGKKDVIFKWYETDEYGNVTDKESTCIEPGKYAVKIYAGQSGNLVNGTVGDTGRLAAIIKVDGKTQMNSVKVKDFKKKLPYNSGAEVKQAVTLKSGTHTLSECKVPGDGGDYTVEYKNNREAGTATVIYEAVKDETGEYTGRYAGKLIKIFKITGKTTLTEAAQGTTKDTLQAGECMVILGTEDDNDEYEFTNAAIKPTVTVLARVTANNGTETITLRQGKDYTVKYKNNKAVASADAKKNNKDIAPQIIIKGKGNYILGSGSGIVKRFAITPFDLSTAILTISDKAYSKKANVYKKTTILITDRDYKNLKLKAGAGKDYTVAYATSDGTNTPAAGQAVTVTITGNRNPDGSGTGSCTGQVTGSYRIMDGKKHKDINKAKVIINPNAKGKTQPCIYTGSGIEPGQTGQPLLKITFGSGKNLQVLTEKTASNPTGDYEILGYFNNVNKGSGAVVLIRGTGNTFRGVRAVKFKISSIGVNNRWGGVFGRP